MKKKDTKFKEECCEAMIFALMNLIVKICCTFFVFCINGFWFIGNDTVGMSALASLMMSVILSFIAWLWYFVFAIIKLSKTVNDENMTYH